MFGEAQLTLASKSGVLTIPASAVQKDGGQIFVYTIEDGKLARRPVTLGMSGNNGSGDAVEVTAGLDKGAQIIRTNLGMLRTGTPVKIVGTGPAPQAASAAPNVANASPARNGTAQ